MALEVNNATQVVSLTVNSTSILNLPINNNINRDGNWYVYKPINNNNDTLGATLLMYDWGVQGNGAANIAMEGTMATHIEPWEGNNTIRYHGGVNEHIGAGINDITNAIEDDAFFFAHMGSLSVDPDDDAFYWDRLYIPTGNTDWYYYQYHKHLPTFYTRYENGRQVTSAGNYINPADKSFGYCIHSRVSVAGTPYQSILARVHTPSIGGAHNSHNDVTLPTISTRNYQMGGMIKGVGSRFHAFYISANGSQWDLHSRTYLDSTGSFTAENVLGTFDLADPTIDRSDTATAGNCYNYPVRASAGDVLDTKIYFPVILTNASNSSNFDLQMWSLISSDSITGGSLATQSLYTDVGVRPDCQMCTVGSKIYALSTDVTNGGVDLWSYDGTTLEGPTQVLTNANTNYVRVHGFRYNSEDAKFYTILSGTSGGASPTYLGPGLYTFELGGTFAGYEHLDYDVSGSTYSFKTVAAQTNGYLKISHSDGSLTRSGDKEPQGIATGTGIATYQGLKPNFFHRTEVTLGGDEFYYQGIYLRDGRKLLAGRIRDGVNGYGEADILLTIVDAQNENKYHFSFAGVTSDPDDPTAVITPVQGDDWVTGVYQSPSDPDKVWLVGFGKSEFVPKKDMWIHGYCRNLSDAPNQITMNDIVRKDGFIYIVGTNSDGYCTVVKYCENYILRWQKQIGYDNAVTGNSIDVDSNGNVYVVGEVEDDTSQVAVVAKINSSGTEQWMNTYGTSNTESGTGIAVVTLSSTEYVAVSVVDGTKTTFLILDTDGAIYEQSEAASTVVNRLRNNVSTTNGRFLFAGTDGSTNGKFGMCEINSTSRMVQWTSTYGTAFNDIRNIDGGATQGIVVAGKTSTSGLVVKLTYTESAGPTYTVTKSWARTLATSEFKGLAVSPYGDTTKYIYAVGYSTTGGSAAMGMNEGVIVRYDADGNIKFQNVFGHDMDESFTGAVLDSLNRNIHMSGWSESHSAGRDGLIFRAENGAADPDGNGGYGTGTYHLAGNAGVPYYYLKSTLADAAETNSITNLTAPSDTSGSLSANTTIPLTFTSSGLLEREFDGSYGENGVFMTFWGYVSLEAIQTYLNSDQYKQNQEAGIQLNYTDDIWTFYQVGTVGDGSADDGNTFGYDIIEDSNGLIWFVGQISGDLQQTNPGTSGVYDYFLCEWDPATEEFEIYQNGTELDEEVYAVAELADGRIAFTGRTTGDLTGGGSGGATPQLGGYDIFLGIFNPADSTFDYYNTGTGFDERGVNLHDIGSNTLVITYSTYGSLGANNLGPEDVGIIKFDYDTDTWGTAYQTGTTSADIFDQLGKHSALLDDGRIAVAFSSAGQFDPDVAAGGFLDMTLALINPANGQVTKAQVGSQTSEIAHFVSAAGERLLIGGTTTGSFGEGGEGIYVECDIQFGLGSKNNTSQT